MYIARLRTLGNNLCCGIPRNIWRQMGWHQGDIVAVTPTSADTVTLRKVDLHARRPKPVPAHTNDSD